MSKSRNQSTIINNFFTLASIIIITVTLTLYVKYIVPKQNIETKTITKDIQKLSCEEDSFTSYKVFNQALIDDSQKALSKGFYKLSGGFIEQSDGLKSYVSLKELDEYFINAIGSTPKEKIKKYLNINYELVEGPNKKSTCKFCEANLIVSFRAASKELFRIDSDVILINKTELKSRINCLVKVYKNHGK